MVVSNNMALRRTGTSASVMITWAGQHMSWVPQPNGAIRHIGNFDTTYRGPKAWWRHQMETFSVLLVLCAGNSPVTVELPSQRPVTRSFGVFFDLYPNKRLSKQSRRGSRRLWFETPPRSLWRHCNGTWPKQDIDTHKQCHSRSTSDGSFVYSFLITIKHLI